MSRYFLKPYHGGFKVYYKGDFIRIDGASKGYMAKSVADIRKGDGKSPLPYHHILVNVLCKEYRSTTSGGLWLYKGTHNPLRATTHPVVNGDTRNPALYRLDGDMGNLINQALERLGGQRISAGQAIVESRQTLKFVAGRARDALRVLRDVRRGDLSKFGRRVGLRRKHLSGDLSDRWLEAQFAFKPLAGDVHDAYEIAQNRLKERLIVHSSASHSDLEDYVLVNGAGNREHNITNSRKTVKLYAEVVDPDLDLSRQLGMANPASLAWEVVPFSFVADWFVPVGTMLRASTAHTGIRFINGYKSNRITSVINVVKDDIDWRGDVSYNETEHFINAYQRWIFHDLPNPVITVRKNPLSTWHAVTALALIRKVFF